MEKLLVFDDPVPNTGPWNMAMDQALGEMAGTPLLRVYGWEQATVSIGYFEKIKAARQLRPDIPLVRRWTGGGLVDHGEDWTYSLIFPSGNPVANCSREESYARIHAVIQRLLERLKKTTLSLAAKDSNGGDGCFSRPVRGDILDCGKKIAGAAQRRTRHFLLHQGSVQKLPANTLSAEILAGGLADTWEPFSPSQEIQERAQNLTATRYCTTAWLEKF